MHYHYFIHGSKIKGEHVRMPDAGMMTSPRGATRPSRLHAFHYLEECLTHYRIIYCTESCTDRTHTPLDSPDCVVAANTLMIRGYVLWKHIWVDLESRQILSRYALKCRA